MDGFQYVCLDNHYSNSSHIDIGFPQGSILGPLLFLICIINDMFNALNCSATLFADDTCLLINDKNYNTLENDCNNELNCIQNWMACNKLMINLSKSQVLIFPYSKTVSA